MTNSATRAVHGLFKWAIGLSMLILVMLALLVAWWIALLLVASWLLYAGVRRLLRGPKKSTVNPSRNIIDGEFRVEQEPGTARQEQIVRSESSLPGK